MRSINALLLLTAVALFAACSGSDVTRDMTAEERFRQAMNYYNDEDYLEALADFDVIRLQYPGSAISDSARYFAGMARCEREEYLLASYEFNQVRLGAPNSALLADAQYMYAMSFVMLSPKMQLDQTYTLRAIDAVQTFVEMYPKHPKAEEAESHIQELYNKLAEKEYETGLLYLNIESPGSAMLYFDNVVARCYNTPYADDALYQKSQILVKQKRSAKAGEAIVLFLSKYPSSPFRSNVEELQKTVGAFANGKEEKRQ